MSVTAHSVTDRGCSRLNKNISERTQVLWCLCRELLLFKKCFAVLLPQPQSVDLKVEVACYCPLSDMIMPLCAGWLLTAKYEHHRRFADILTMWIWRLEQKWSELDDIAGDKVCCTNRGMRRVSQNLKYSLSPCQVVSALKEALASASDTTGLFLPKGEPSSACLAKLNKYFWQQDFKLVTLASHSCMCPASQMS